VFQYSLSSAWDLSTASYDSVFFDTASQELAPFGLFFKPDGTKMYIAGSNSDSVFQYSLSSAWDLSTATYDSVSFSAASQDTAVTGVTFTSDGTKMFITGSANDSIFQYSLSTPWNVSTATYDSVSFSITSQETLPRQLFVKESSYILYLVGSASDSVSQYNLGNKFNAFRGAGNIYSYGNVNGGNNRGINFTPPGTQLIPFF
jgi:6-phosphogluconolactonase (cycloisomerase 2 family)